MDLTTVTNQISGKDYGKALRLRRRSFLAILAIGLVWIGCNIWLVPHYDLGDYARVCYLGGAWGMTGGGLGLLAYNEWMLRHPEKWKRARIRETDERSQRIHAGATQIAVAWMNLLRIPALLVLVVVDVRLALVLVAVEGVYSLLFLAARVYLSRKL